MSTKKKFRMKFY